MWLQTRTPSQVLKAACCSRRLCPAREVSTPTGSVRGEALTGGCTGASTELFPEHTRRSANSEIPVFEAEVLRGSLPWGSCSTPVRSPSPSPPESGQALPWERQRRARARVRWVCRSLHTPGRHSSQRFAVSFHSCVRLKLSPNNLDLFLWKVPPAPSLFLLPTRAWPPCLPRQVPEGGYRPPPPQGECCRLGTPSS